MLGIRKSITEKASKNSASYVSSLYAYIYIKIVFMYYILTQALITFPTFEGNVIKKEEKHSVYSHTKYIEKAKNLYLTCLIRVP